MTSVIPEASTATPDPREQRDHTRAGADAVSRAFDAIEDVFAVSPNPELTRQGLRGFIDMIADTMQHTQGVTA